MDRFDQRAEQLKLASDNACAEYIGVNRATLMRIRRGDMLPGEKFIAQCLSSGFASSFEWLFELADAS